jgi:multiple sugar transport system substrate-binding protein
LPDLRHIGPDVVLSLDELLNNEDPFVISDFYSGQLEAYRLDGKLYGLPLSDEPTLMFYNKDLVTRLGIDPPDYDWTFDDFLDIATAASTASGENQTYGFLSYAPEDIYLFLAGREAVWSDVSAELPIVHFNQPDVVNAYEWLSSLARSGVLYPVSTKDSSIMAADLVSSGNVVFWTDFGGSWNGWYWSGELKFSVGAVPLPQTVNANQVTAVRKFGQFISRSAESPRSCWEWIKFLSEQPNAFSGIPARRSKLESDTWRASVGAEKASVYQAVMSQNSLNWIHYDDPHWNPILYWGNVAFGEVLNGQDAEQALQVAQRKADRFLACLESSNQSTYSGNALEEKIKACSMDADGN